MTNIQKGYMYNLLSVLMVAIGPLFSKFGLLYISPAKAAILNVITVITASYLFGYFSKRKVQFYVEKEIILLALFNSLGVIFLFLSTDLLSPVEIGFIGRFYTVFAVVLSVVFLHEKLTKREIIFIVIAVLGAFLFVKKDGLELSDIGGTLCAILYTFFFALTNIFIKKTMSTEKSSNSILFTNNCITLLFVCLYSLVSGDIFDGEYSLKGIGFITLSSLLAGFLGTILLYEAIKYLRFSIANVMRAFSPLLLACISFPFFPIKITLQNTLGACLLLISIFLLTLGDKKNEEKKARKSS
ncbi:DMT family transporter [Fredinandcohnia humi]